MQLKMLNVPAMMLAGLLLTGCETTTDSGATDALRVACMSFVPIRWSKLDTDKTLEQVREHNAAGKKLCGWGKRDVGK